MSAVTEDRMMNCQVNFSLNKSKVMNSMEKGSEL